MYGSALKVKKNHERRNKNIVNNVKEMFRNVIILGIMPVNTLF